MKIQFKMDGGIAAFPGLSKPVLVDSDALSADDAAQLQQLVNAARFFDLPAKVGQPLRGAADYRTYTITIEDGKQRRTVSIVDPIEDANLAALIDYLKAKR